mgnify:CR=1 FL=1
MLKKKVNRVSKQDDSMLFAFLAVFLSIVGFVIAFLAKRDDKYVMFYAKESLILFFGCFIVQVTKVIPVIGDIIFAVGFAIVVVLWIIQIINALSGEEKETPFTGKYAKKINL